jgi:hypothetical protein
MASFEVETNYLPQGEPFKGRLVGFRVVECRTSTSTTGTSNEKKLSGRPWEKASTLLPIYFWTIGSDVALVFCFLIYSYTGQ